MSAVELKPCPFCGATDGRLVQAFTRATDDFAFWSVECLDCGVEVADDESQERADFAWNRRTRPTPALDEAGARAILKEAEADCGCRIPSPFDEVAEHAVMLAARAVAERPRDTSAAVEGGSTVRDTQGAQQPAAEVEAETIERCAKVADAEEQSAIVAYRDESTLQDRAYRRGRAEAAQAIGIALRDRLFRGAKS